MGYRISVWVAIFLVFFNAGAVFIDSTGTDEYLGIEPDTGDVSEIEQAESSTQKFDTGTGQGQTLLGTYNRLSSTLNEVINAVQPGKEMLEAAGVPASVTGFLWSGFGMILGIDIVLFLRGLQ